MPIENPEAALDQLAQAFSQWRATKASRNALIPDDLLDRARELSQQLPATQVLRRLKMTRPQLQRERRSSSDSGPSVEFVAMNVLASPLSTGVMPSIPETPLTFRLNQGPLLTLTGLPTSQLIPLIVALLER